MTRILTPRIKTNKGFTLLEVLITMVVMSLGLLGFAGLQMASLKNSASAYQRSQATVLTYDMLDRMRANRAQAVAGTYNIAFGASSGGSGVAGDDLVAWKAVVENNLPGGDAAITVDAAGNALVQIRWGDKRDRSASDDTTLNTQSVL